ncbi:RNA-directed DNA polymerase from mobile element jockey [Caerostris darwini]|uniref:RNA-directed DNA polymerase from mobile element jockey n=1 Tax=Caerostris darwini TaxID=1538125 RepID=A0AAV4Q1X6_9ARAC|nr:RNA-directed DNA polymerase from mobile element jockey [Caerostris darwini]
MNPAMPQNSLRPPGSVRPPAANGQDTARAGSPIASTSTATPAAMDFEPSTPTPTLTENLVDLSIGSAVAYLVERGVPLIQETLQHMLPPMQDKCITSAQLLQVRHLMQLREDYTVFLNDINDMKRASSATDNIHSSDRKIVEYFQKNNDQLQDWVSHIILNMQNSNFLITSTNTYSDIFDTRIPFKVATPFVTVKQRKRKSTATPTATVNQKIKTTNSFATLSDLETEDELATNISTMAIQGNTQPTKQKPKTKKHTSATPTNQPQPINVTPSNTTSNVRPIMISKPNDTIAFMRKINTDLNFSITCKHTASYLKIEPATEDNHTIITRYLDNNNIPYYIITPKGLRPIKCVIRGLPINTDLELIKTSLVEKNFNILNVFQLRKRDQERSPMPLFQIQVEATPEAENIWNLDSLLYTKIKIEKYNSTGTIGQCHRCQLFGHSSINCRLPARCVKCAGPHLTGECTHTTKMENPICANCKGPHPASYRGCPKFPKPATNNNQPKTFTSTTTNPKVSYASLLTPQQPLIITPEISSPLNSLKDIIMDPEILQLLSALHKVLPSIKEFCSWNANGLLNKISDLQRNDFILSDNRRRYSYPGGTGIFIKRHIPHQHIPTPPLASIQATIIQLNFPNPTAFISTYIPPQKKNPSNPNRHLFPINDLLTIHNSFSTYFIAGDLNCHHRSWNCSRANPFDIQLFKFTQQQNWHIAAPPTPTRFGSVTPSTIDIAILRNFSHHCLATSIPAMTSDHNPVIFNIDSSLPNNNIPKRYIPNWEKFNHLLSTASYTPTNLNTQHGIENSINHLTQLITTCYDASCNTVNANIKNSHISSSLRAKIIIRNRLRKTWQTTRHPADKANYINYNRNLQQDIRNLPRYDFTLPENAKRPRASLHNLQFT